MVVSLVECRCAGARYGLLVARSYRELGGDPGRARQAAALGWAVELQRAAANLAAELATDRKVGRNGQEDWSNISANKTTSLFLLWCRAPKPMLPVTQL